MRAGLDDMFGPGDSTRNPHDLGEEFIPYRSNKLTGYDLAKWLVDQDLSRNSKFIPLSFDFRVHSQNPVGAKNIQNLLDQYLRVRQTPLTAIKAETKG